jgi:hypothetical protein
MSNRLAVYNGALLVAGERQLASLTEDREPRHLLDLVWNDGGVDTCLSEGQWKFAMRSVRLDFDPAVEPAWGLRRAFLKPDDWVITSAIAQDEFFNTPLLNYVDEADYWYADLDEIYVRYVSNHADFGNNIGEWPSTFAEYVKAHFAYRIIHKLTADKERWQLVRDERDDRKLLAKNKDAMGDPTKFAAEGAWNRSRRGSGRKGPLGDGGTTGSLIG